MLRWVEGFEADQSTTYLGRKYASYSGGGSFAAGRLFGTCLTQAAAVSTIRTPSLSSQAGWYIGLGFKSNSATATIDYTVRCFIGASEQLRFRMVASAAATINIEVIRGSTTLATMSSAFATNAWQYLEFYVLAHTSTGAWEVRVNESTAGSQSGVNTADSGSNNADVFAFQRDAGGTNPQIDDIYICDDTTAINNTWRGDSNIEAIFPTTDGALEQWTTSTGTNSAALIDDAATAPNDADYVFTGTVGNRDTFVYGNLVQTLGTIYGVVALADARLDVAGTRGFKQTARIGSTNYDGAEHTVANTSVAQFMEIFEQNPATSLDWTNSDVDGAEFGFVLST
jgi:hypothetical protein